MAEYKGVKEPDEDGPWRVVIQPRSVTPAENAATDDKGFSEETCVRCGWRMGSPALNCQNNNTPHVFPSQAALLAKAEAADDWHVELQTRLIDAEAERDAAVRAAEADRDLLAGALKATAEAAEQAQAALRGFAEGRHTDREGMKIARAALTGDGTE